MIPAPTDARLRRHLRAWLGRWPPRETAGHVDVVGSRRRREPGWDGRIFPLIGVGTPDALVLSVPPSRATAVAARLRSLDPGGLEVICRRLTGNLPALLNRPDLSIYCGVFRYCDRPATTPDAGDWVDVDGPEAEQVPAWLRPFGHQVLIARDPLSGAYLAGVGIKHHDRYGRELAVGTAPHARGRGLARRLVAQAARRVLDEGAIATYQHDPANISSARVAEAAGFPDRGWRSMGMG